MRLLWCSTNSPPASPPRNPMFSKLQFFCLNCWGIFSFGTNPKWENWLHDFHWCWQVVPVAEMAYRVTNSASWDLAGPLVEKSLVIDQAWRNPQTLSQPGIKKEQHAQTIMINHEVWDSPFQGFKVVHYIHVFMYWKYCWPVHWSTITWKICIDLGRCCLGAQWKPCNCLLVDV